MHPKLKVMYRKILICLIITAVLVFIIQEIVKSQIGLGWPVNEKLVTSPFGKRTHPVTGEQSSFHNGIDIATPSGTPIHSPASGIVTKNYYNDAGGNQLVIKHDNGYTTGYAHLSKSMVSIGEKIKKNQIIGLTGATGKVTGPHLHLTVKSAAGDYLDPQKILV